MANIADFTEDDIIINARGKLCNFYSSIRTQQGANCTFYAMGTGYESAYFEAHGKLAPTVSYKALWEQAIIEQIKVDPNNTATTALQAVKYFNDKGLFTTSAYILIENREQLTKCLRYLNLPVIIVIYKGETFTDEYAYRSIQEHRSGGGHTVAIVGEKRDGSFNLVKDSAGPNVHNFPPTTKGNGYFKISSNDLWSYKDYYTNAKSKETGLPIELPNVHRTKIAPLVYGEKVIKAIELGFTVNYAVSSDTSLTWSKLDDHDKQRQVEILRGIDITLDQFNDYKNAKKYEPYMANDPITRKSYELYLQEGLA